MKKLLLFMALVSLCLMFTVSIDAKIDPGMIVGIWTFDKDGDASDVSGKGHNGKFEGKVKWVDGKFGKAVELDGNSFVLVDHADDMSLQTFTLMAWVNIPTPPTDWWTVACKDGWPNRNYGIWLASGTALAHNSFTSGAAPDNNAINAVTPVKAKEWHHVAASYDMKVSKLYIDGKLDAQGNFTVKPNVTDVQFIIGRTANGSYKYVGMTDEVGLFNKALSEEDINSVMTNGLKLATAVNPETKLATTWADVKSR
ncbi:MAG: LamG protein [Candidatus Poribacteria bacterium]|nr:LamG protein [Candidatus Poribacteria bacterium]